MRTIIVAIGLLSVPCQAADMPTSKMTKCETHKPHGAKEYWSWRELTPGRKCWYEGHPGKPKSQLFWPAATEEPAEPTRPTVKILKTRPINQPPNEPPAVEQHEPASQVAPEDIPVPGSFEDRWKPVPRCGEKTCDSRMPQ